MQSSNAYSFASATTTPLHVQNFPYNYQNISLEKYLLPSAYPTFASSL